MPVTTTHVDNSKPMQSVTTVTVALTTGEIRDKALIRALEWHQYTSTAGPQTDAKVVASAKTFEAYLKEEADDSDTSRPSHSGDAIR
jgi:hypothetical protein